MSALRLVTEEFEQTFGLEEGLAHLERGGPLRQNSDSVYE